MERLGKKDIVSNMIFGIEYIVPYLSTFMELKPGDIIATGTPPGAGTYFDPRNGWYLET